MAIGVLGQYGRHVPGCVMADVHVTGHVTPHLRPSGASAVERIPITRCVSTTRGSAGVSTKCSHVVIDVVKGIPNTVMPAPVNLYYTCCLDIPINEIDSVTVGTNEESRKGVFFDMDLLLVPWVSHILWVVLSC